MITKISEFIQNLVKSLIIVQGHLTILFHFHHPNYKFSELRTLLESGGGGGEGHKDGRNLIVSFISWKRQLKISKL